MKSTRDAEAVAVAQTALARAATSPDPSTRLHALADLIRESVLPPADQIDHLITLADDSDRRVRLLFQKYLRHIIETDRLRSREYRAPLERGLRDPDCSIRVAALEAIGRTLPTVQTDMLRLITDAVFDLEEIVRHQAAALLLALGDQAIPAAEQLARAIVKCEPTDWDAAVNVLVNLDPEGRVTGTVLVRQMKPDHLAALRDYLSVRNQNQFLGGLQLTADAP